MNGPVHHLALAEDRADAVRTGAYRMSTLGITLAEQLFVRCSFPHQVGRSPTCSIAAFTTSRC
ncbi:MAG: hypothetical protein ACRDWI_07035 [Jiangellaceae bacterium]